MKITPIPYIPETVEAAVQEYTFGTKPQRYGVTTLLKPVQQVILERRHPELINEETEDQIWRLLGSGFHKILEDGAKRLHKDGSTLKSEYFIGTIIFDRYLSGVIDLSESEDEILDYKLTSAKAVTLESRTDEWIWQLNIYRWLFHLHGQEINKLKVCAFFKDWNMRDKMRLSDYPLHKIQTYELPLLSLEDVEKYVVTRIGYLVMAEWMPDKQLPPCSPEEMWQREDQYKVFKGRTIKGVVEWNQRATRVLESEDVANAYAEKMNLKKGEQVKVVKFPGRRVKCEGAFEGDTGYCPVAHICPQHQAYLAEKEDMQ